MVNRPSQRIPPRNHYYYAPCHPSRGLRQCLESAPPPQSGLHSQAPTSFGAPAQPQARHHDYPPNHLAHPRLQISLDRYRDPPNNPWSICPEPFQVHHQHPYQTQSLQQPKAHNGYGESPGIHPGTPRSSFLTPYQSPYPPQNQEYSQDGSRAAFTDHSNRPQGDFPAQAQHPRQINPYRHTPAPVSFINNNDQNQPQESVLTPHQAPPEGADNRRHPKSSHLHQPVIWQMRQMPPQNPASQNWLRMTTSPATQECHRNHQMVVYGQINVSGGFHVTASTSQYEQPERAPQHTVPSLTFPYQIYPQIVASGSNHDPHVAHVEGPSQIPGESSKSKKRKRGKNASRGPYRNAKKTIPSQHHQSESQDILNQQHRDTAQNIQNKQHLSATPKMENQEACVEPLTPAIDFQSQKAPVKSLAPPIDTAPWNSDIASHDPDQTALENFALRPEGNGNVFFTPHSSETLEETYYRVFPEVMPGYKLVKEREDALKMQERKEQLKEMEDGNENMEEFVDFAASRST